MPTIADVWLGEAGQLLIRAVDCEIPCLRKQSATMQQHIIDLERRHVDLLKSAASAAKECKQVGPPESLLTRHPVGLPAGGIGLGTRPTSWGLSKLSKWSRGSTRSEAAWQNFALLFAHAPI